MSDVKITIFEGNKSRTDYVCLANTDFKHLKQKSIE